MTAKKADTPLELVLRHGDTEAVHVFPTIGDFDVAMWELTVHCGVPITAELVSMVSTEVLLTLLHGGPGYDAHVDAGGGYSPLIRKLAAELVTAIEEKQ